MPRMQSCSLLVLAFFLFNAGQVWAKPHQEWARLADC